MAGAGLRISPVNRAVSLNFRESQPGSPGFQKRSARTLQGRAERGSAAYRPPVDFRKELCYTTTSRQTFQEGVLMTCRNVFRVAACAMVMNCASSLVSAQAPFTIRRPPDNATVREKVVVEIPRSSIPSGAFVAFYIDDNFDVAISPQTGNRGSFFEYVWNTKDRDVADGPHTIRAVLFTPAP